MSYWDNAVDVNTLPSGNLHTIYGISGSGKTTLLASYPKPMMYIDIKDKGHKSAQGLKGIKVKRIEIEEDMAKLVEVLQKAKKVPFRTLGLDNMSNYQDLVLLKGIQKRTGRRKLQIDDWGYISNNIKNLISDLKDEAERLGIIVVFVVQQKANDVDDDGGDDLPEIVPNLIKSVHPFITSLSDYVFHTNKVKKGKDAKYSVDLGINTTYVTKVRTTYTNRGKTPKRVVNPTYKKIMKVLDEVEK